MTSAKDLEYIPCSAVDFIRVLNKVANKTSSGRKDIRGLFKGKYHELREKGIFRDMPEYLSRAIFFIYFQRMHSVELYKRISDFSHAYVVSKTETGNVCVISIISLWFNNVKVLIHVQPDVNLTKRVMLKSTYLISPQRNISICVKEEFNIDHYDNDASTLYRTLCAFYYAFKISEQQNKEA